MRKDNRVLSVKELGEFDQFAFKAHAILDEARRHLECFRCDLAVRRSQEALELYIKTIFLYIGGSYPKTHDLQAQIYEISRLLEEYTVKPEDVAGLVLGNSTLALWRSPSLYGDETLKIARLFGRKEAEVAICYAEKAWLVCERVRVDLYRRAL